MSRKIGVCVSCVTAMVIFGCESDVEIKSFATTVPVAYSTRQANGKQYTVTVGSFLNQRLPKRFFHYMIADEHQPAGGVEDDPILETHQNPETLLYRGNLIIYVFGGWGRVRSEHIVTASEALTSPPFGIYPVTPTQSIVMTFDSATEDGVSLKATHGPNESKPLKANQYVVVTVDPSTDIATFSVPKAIPDLSSTQPVDQDAKAAYKTITSLRTALQLP